MSRKKLSVPENTNWPFFAYGFFKPNELAYNQISKYSEGPAEEAYVYGRFYEKDGVPILKTDISENEGTVVMGSIIKFISSKQEEAYEVISSMEPPALYRWTSVIANRKKTNERYLVNILVYAGNNTANGIIPGAEPSESGKYYWKCREDPLMNKRMAYLRQTYFQTLMEYYQGIRKRGPIFLHDFWGRLFQIQMAYVFLWTIIDRYKSLKYGLNLEIGDGNEKLAGDSYWRESIQQIEDILQRNPINLITRGINSRGTQLGKTLMDRFYDIRCNAVHRGKAVHNDQEILTQAFMLLYPIVSYIITCDVHHEEGEAKKQLEKDCEAIRSVFRLKR